MSIYERSIRRMIQEELTHIIEGVLDGATNGTRPTPAPSAARAAARAQDLENAKRSADAAAKRLGPAVKPVKDEVGAMAVGDVKKMVKDFGKDKAGKFTRDEANKVSAAVLNLTKRDPQGAREMADTMKKNSIARTALLSTPGVNEFQAAAAETLRADGKDPRTAVGDEWRTLGKLASKYGLSENALRRIIREEAGLVIDEVAAHEEDFIAKAYSGGAESTPPEPPAEETEPAEEEEEEPAEEPVDEPAEGDGDAAVEDDGGNEGENTTLPARIDGSGGEDSEPGSDDAEVRESLWSQFRDSRVIDFGLDILGTVGGWVADAATAGTGGAGAPIAYTLAAVPDLLNSARHAARGESFDAAVYFLCALPIIGDVLGPVHISVKLFRTTRYVHDIRALIDTIRRLAKNLRISLIIDNVIPKIKDVCNRHFPSFNVDAVADDAVTILKGSDEEVDDLIARSKAINDEIPDGDAPDPGALTLAELYRTRRSRRS